MTKPKFEVTEDEVAVLKVLGWTFSEDMNKFLTGGWYKYNRQVLVATGGGATWYRDVASARLASMHEGEAKLSEPVIDLLEGMGWKWTMTCHDAWEWVLFNPAGMTMARQGSAPWVEDLFSARLLAAKDEDFSSEEIASMPRFHVYVTTPAPEEKPKKWAPTMELRQKVDIVPLYTQGPYWPRLQQKWVLSLPAGQSSEWRDVPFVDAMGVILV